MTANTLPIFVDTPVVGQARISTANTNRDGSGTLGTVASGGSDGTRINQISIKATGTTSAGMVRFFIHDGTNYRLWREVIVTAITPTASKKSFEYYLSLKGEEALMLPNGYSLRAATHNANEFDILAFGGNY